LESTGLAAWNRICRPVGAGVLGTTGLDPDHDLIRLGAQVQVLGD
jgi:hypothetical protein